MPDYVAAPRSYLALALFRVFLTVWFLWAFQAGSESAHPVSTVLLHTKPKNSSFLAVICAKNPTKTLLDTVDGLIKFYPGFDIVVIDSASEHVDVYKSLPQRCRVVFSRNRDWEIGAWVYAIKHLPNYAFYLMIQDTILPVARPDWLDAPLNASVLYSFHYSARLDAGGYIEELRHIFVGSEFDFIAQMDGDASFVGMAHNSFLAGKEVIVRLLRVNDILQQRVQTRTKVHEWLAERFLGLIASSMNIQRVAMNAYFLKLHGGRH